MVWVLLGVRRSERFDVSIAVVVVFLGIVFLDIVVVVVFPLDPFGPGLGAHSVERLPIYTFVGFFWILIFQGLFFDRFNRFNLVLFTLLVLVLALGHRARSVVE